MARESTTANGSTLYQVKLTLISRILQDDDVSIDGAVRDALIRFATKRKSAMGFVKAAMTLDSLTGHDVSGAVEQFEDEQNAPIA